MLFFLSVFCSALLVFLLEMKNWPVVLTILIGTLAVVHSAVLTPTSGKTNSLNSLPSAIYVLGAFNVPQMANGQIVNNDSVTLQIVNPGQLDGKNYHFLLGTQFGNVVANVVVEPSRFVLQFTPIEVIPEKAQVTLLDICDGDPVIDPTTFTTTLENPDLAQTPNVAGQTEFNTNALDIAKGKFHTESFRNNNKKKITKASKVTSHIELDDEQQQQVKAASHGRKPSDFIKRLQKMANSHRKNLKDIQKFKTGMTHSASDHVQSRHVTKIKTHRDRLIEVDDIHGENVDDSYSPFHSQQQQQDTTETIATRKFSSQAFRTDATGVNNGGDGYNMELFSNSGASDDIAQGSAGPDDSLAPEYSSNAPASSQGSLISFGADISGLIDTSPQASADVLGRQINCAELIHQNAAVFNPSYTNQQIIQKIHQFHNYQLGMAGPKAMPTAYCSFADNLPDGTPFDSEGTTCVPLMAGGNTPLTDVPDVYQAITAMTDDEFAANPGYQSKLQGTPFIDAGSSSSTFNRSGYYFESATPCNCSPRNRTAYKICATNPWIVDTAGPGHTPLSGILQKCVKAASQFICMPVTMPALLRDQAPEISQVISGCDASDHASAFGSCAGSFFGGGGNCDGCTQIDVTSYNDAVRAYEYEQDASNNLQTALGVQQLFNQVNTSLYANQNTLNVGLNAIALIGNLTAIINVQTSTIEQVSG